VEVAVDQEWRSELHAFLTTAGSEWANSNAALQQRNNIGIGSNSSESPCGRQSIGRVANSYTTICNSGHTTMEIDNTAGNSHTYNNAKHNELNHARIEGPVTFGLTTCSMLGRGRALADCTISVKDIRRITISRNAKGWKSLVLLFVSPKDATKACLRSLSPSYHLVGMHTR